MERFPPELRVETTPDCRGRMEKEDKLLMEVTVVGKVWGGPELEETSTTRKYKVSAAGMQISRVYTGHGTERKRCRDHLRKKAEREREGQDCRMDG